MPWAIPSLKAIQGAVVIPFFEINDEIRGGKEGVPLSVFFTISKDEVEV